MSRSFLHRLAGIGEDFFGALRGSGLPLRSLLQREDVAAWRQFQDFPRAGVRTLVDVGAHEGLYARRAARYFSLGRVICVEPLPEFAAKLRQLRLPGLEVVEAALSDHPGEATFTISATAQASSLREINPAMTEAYQLNMAAAREIPVRLTTLDQLASERRLERIDLLKVDVQGAERELLAGAQTALARTRWVQLEVLFVEHYRGCARFFELDEMMQSAGFRLCRLTDFSHGPQGELLQADAVYLNTRLA